MDGYRRRLVARHVDGCLAKWMDTEEGWWLDMWMDG